MFCDDELTGAIKHSGFSYLWPLELKGSEEPQISFLLHRLCDASFFGVLTQLSLCQHFDIKNSNRH